MLTTFKREAYNFFKEHGGQLVGRQAEMAARMARAELIGSEMGWYVDWYDDPDGDLGEHDFWCKGDRAEVAPGVWRKHPCNHQIEQALLRDEDGEVLASLGGIIDASREYRRVVEAELMVEAVDTGAHERPPKPPAMPEGMAGHAIKLYLRLNAPERAEFLEYLNLIEGEANE